MRVDQLAHNPVDAWLLNYHEKYRILIPKDENCLYRAIAEQMCLTQDHYSKVKMKLVNYSGNHGMENLQAFEDLELNAKLDIVSAAYERNVVLFTEVGAVPKTFGKYGGTKQTIYLRLDTEDDTFESVRDIEHMKAMALCQSLIYGALYEGVFGMKEVDVKDTVQKVRQKLYNHPHKLDRRRLAMQTSPGTSDGTNVEELPPFPFRVAKSLDPAFFRNAAFDVWQDSVKEKGQQFKLGDKVFVTFEGENVIGHVQSIQDNEVSVFIQPQGKGRNVTVSPEEVSKPPTPKRCPNKARATRSLSYTPAEGSERRVSTPLVNPIQQPSVVSHPPTPYLPPVLQPQNLQMYSQLQLRLPVQQPVPQPTYYVTNPCHQVVHAQGVPGGYSQPPQAFYQPQAMPTEQQNFPTYYVQQYPGAAPNARSWTYNNAEWNMSSMKGPVVQLAGQVTPQPQQMAPTLQQM